MSTSPNKLQSAAHKLPVFGDYQQDKARREAQNQWFLENHGNHHVDPEPTVGEWFRSLAPTKRDTIKYLEDSFPCSKWILNYNISWLVGDLIAGLTVGAVIIPQGMAYAKLANLPVEMGLYTSFIGGIIYFIFGSSKDINIGPIAVASIITGTIVDEIQHDLPNESRAVIAGLLAMLSGAAVFIMAILRLGWLVDLIALPAIAAFVSGVAITIGSSQLPALLGIQGVNTSDPSYKVIISVLKHLGSAKIDAALGISSLVLLYLLKWVTARLSVKRSHQAKFWFFMSSLRTVVTILIYILVSFIVNHKHKESPSFKILGFVPRGFQMTSSPTFSQELVTRILPNLPAMVIVLLIEHLSIAKSFGRLNNYTINTSSEFLAIGITNLVGPLMGAYSASGSFSRTAINSKAGSRTPLAGVFTAGLVVVAIYLLTPMLYFVPNAALSGVIIHAILDLITAPSTVYKFWRISPFDVVVFVVGLTITIFQSVETGLFAMIGLSLGIQLWRIFKAHGHLLGKVNIRTIHHAKKSEGDFGEYEDAGARSVFLPLDKHDGSNPQIEIKRPYPGIFIYRMSEGFNFPNASHQLDQLADAIKDETRPTTVRSFAKKGDVPWNESAKLRGEKEPEQGPDLRPTLKAVILDFSAVNHIDLTAVQALIDTRNLLNRHTAPHTAQWHFACIHNRWARRALASAGFGFPSFETESGTPQHFVPVYSLAEQAFHADLPHENEKEPSQDVEAAATSDFIRPSLDINKPKPGESSHVDHIEDNSSNRISKSGATSNMAAERVQNMAVLHGINRPYFHPDLQSALVSAIALEEQTRIMSSGEEDEDVPEASDDTYTKPPKVQQKPPSFQQ